LSEPIIKLRFAHVAKTPRTWTGARTPSGLKRVRQAERRREVLQPRRSAAKTYVAKALAAATQPTDSIDPAAALTEALSALDRAAKAGAIHPNAAARRKSRLAIKVNAAVGGTAFRPAARSSRRPARPPRPRPPGPASPRQGRQGQGAQTAAGKLAPP
jgi:small subunit ribosomal protein S20